MTMEIKNNTTSVTQKSCMWNIIRENVHNPNTSIDCYSLGASHIVTTYARHPEKFTVALSIMPKISSGYIMQTSLYNIFFSFELWLHFFLHCMCPRYDEGWVLCYLYFLFQINWFKDIICRNTNNTSFSFAYLVN